MHQFLFYIGDFPIRSYGVILSLSIFLAMGVGYFMAKVDGRGYEKFIIDIGLVGGFFGLLGARLWDVFFFDWDYYQNHLDEILNVWQGGMAVQGGIIYPDTTLAYRTYGAQPLFPAEVWECQLDVVIFALLLIFRCTNYVKGQCFALYVMLYATARFFLEYLRGDYVNLAFGLLKSAQVTSVVAFALAAGIFIFLQTRKTSRRL